jgi:hypothetical protein
MKKQNNIFYLAIVVLTATSCANSVEPIVNASQTVGVVTIHDKNASFSELKTFSISDSIGVVTDGGEKGYAGTEATAIIANIVSNLETRGFVKVNKNQNPDMVIPVTAFKLLNIVSYYPGYWYGYGGYYGGGYWGYPGYGYYYPYSYTYTYTTGTLMIEAVDVRHRNPINNTMTVVWNCVINGLADGLNNSKTVNKFVNDGFVQSPYVYTTK